MRRTRPSRRRARGFTLLEAVLGIVITGIVVGMVSYFLYPVSQAVDIALRAALSDIADTALRRIGRDVRLALPNSVRVTSDPNLQYLEFVSIRSAGRYRADGGGAAAGANCPGDDAGLAPPENDQLSFDTASDSCFKTIGKLPNASEITASDSVVLNNYGAGFTGQDAYQTAGTLNRTGLSAVDTSEAGRDRVAFDAATLFQRALHDSPGRRFFIVSGPVSYVCDKVAKTVTRYWNYAIQPAQPTGFGGASSALVASKVSDCAFDYTPNVAPLVGLLTLRLTLSEATSSGVPEVVSLYHAVHVSNVP